MKIALLGDIGLFGKYTLNNSDIYDYFREVSNLLKQYDHVIGNLETPFCEENFKTYGSKSAYIYSNEENIEILKYLNIDIVNLANNHLYDYGIEGYQKTKEVLNNNGIKYYGIDGKDLLINAEDAKVALTGFCCYSTNGLGYYNSSSKTGVNILDGFKVENKLQKYHAESYLNIVSVHAGEEHVNYPNYDHVKLARKLATKVPYIYYGHHPHVIQGIEEVNQSLIAYSLGNFCFDDVYTDDKEKPFIKQSINNKESFILSLDIKGDKIVSYETITIKAGINKMEILSDVINDKIEIYSSKLSLDEESYKTMRNNLLSQYLEDRKNKRNLNWYIKRLRPRYFMIVVNALINRKKYKKLILNYIEKG